MFVRWMSPSIIFPPSAAPTSTIRGGTSMPRKVPPNVERNLVKGHIYLSFRIGKGARIRLPDDPSSDEFRADYAAAMAGETRPTIRRDQPGTIGALIAS